MKNHHLKTFNTEQHLYWRPFEQSKQWWIETKINETAYIFAYRNSECVIYPVFCLLYTIFDISARLTPRFQNPIQFPFQKWRLIFKPFAKVLISAKNTFCWLKNCFRRKFSKYHFRFIRDAIQNILLLPFNLSFDVRKIGWKIILRSA